MVFQAPPGVIPEHQQVWSKIQNEIELINESMPNDYE